MKTFAFESWDMAHLLIYTLLYIILDLAIPGLPNAVTQEWWVCAAYQTRQAFSGIIGCPTLQPNALPNSGKFCTLPLMRHLPELCGSVLASTRDVASRTFSHHTCAKPMKYRCSGV